MHEAAVVPSWVLLAYLISGVCFILALRGLSSPESSRRGNRAGMLGMAAVLVGAAAFLNPSAFGIVDGSGAILSVSRIEMGLGVAIGAITFSGSVIAFLKLNGNMSGKPILLPGRHWINLAVTLAIFFFLYGFYDSQSPIDFWTLAALSFAIGFLLIVPIGGADMPVVISMLNSYSGWAAAAMGFTLHKTAIIITGALVGSSGAILS
jgi:NAD(P) transhydrogenase subunit beta